MLGIGRCPSRARGLAGRVATGCVALVAALGAVAALSPPVADGGSVTAGACDKVIDRGERPRHFVRSLRRGQTGCFRAGRTYRSSRRAIVVRAPRVTLTTTPRGARAKLAGRLWLTRRADGASVRRLRLDGRNRARLPSPTVNATGAVFARNIVTTHNRGNCFILGNPDYGRARGTVIRQNRIHHCGRLPATNRDHGIYVSHARNTKIIGNWIHDNADRGVQLYPDADGTTVTGNVIDGNGQGIIFGSSSTASPDRNLVEGNAISAARIRYNVESHSQGAPYGRGNLVVRNCLWATRRAYGGEPRKSGIQDPSRGFATRRNVVARPRYVARNEHDFRLRPDSRCHAVVASSPKGLRR